MSDGLNINWGAFNKSIQSMPSVGESFNAGYEQGQERRAKDLTGKAMQALMADPNGGQEQIDALARIAPDKARALLDYRFQQQERQRQGQFREAATGFLKSGGALNALMPPSAGQGVLSQTSAPSNQQPNALAALGGGSTPPPISAAPPPPDDWQQRLGPETVSALNIPSTSLENDPQLSVQQVQRAPAMRGMAGAEFLPGVASNDQGTGYTAAADPTAIGGGFGAESGVTGQYPPGAAPGADPAAAGVLSPGGAPQNASAPITSRPLPADASMAQRNAYFLKMLEADPIQAMKVDSEYRDQALDRLEDVNKGYQLAVARLPNVQDDAGYQRVLNEVDGLLAPLGVNIRESVPATYPGPEGTRQLLMQAMDAQQQLAAMDRRFSAEAAVADDAADNARADRDTDSKIADRADRTGIARERVGISARREQRMGAGGGGGGRKPTKSKGGGVVPTAVNPKTGERLELRNGKWVTAK